MSKDYAGKRMPSCRCLQILQLLETMHFETSAQFHGSPWRDWAEAHT